MKVITLANLVANIRCRRSGKTFLADFLKGCETHDAIIIREGATNSDVVKAVFPSIESRLDEKTGIMLVKWTDGVTKTFKASWWNAPYKAESEE